MQTTTAYTPLADRLRNYTPALASLARALCDARGALHGTVRAVPQGPARSGRTALLDIACGQGELHLYVDVDDGARAALEAIALEPEAACRAAVASLYLAEPLAALARHGAARPAVQDLRLAAPPAAHTGVLHLEYDHAGATTGITVAGVSADLADTLAAALAERIGSTGRGALPDALATLALPTRLRLRSRLATPALLRSLHPGDVLLGWPAAPGFGPHATLDQATLLWGAANGQAIHARARIDSHNVILESRPVMVNNDPDLSLRAATDVAAAPAPIDVSDVELPVHIEVVTVNLPIGQIAALQPGYLLTLPLALADADIRLVAHGQTLAFGELVAIGDQLGLHIRRIAKSDERHA
jgi:type III secretion protein Q